MLTLLVLLVTFSPLPPPDFKVRVTRVSIVLLFSEKSPFKPLFSLQFSPLENNHFPFFKFPIGRMLQKCGL